MYIIASRVHEDSLLQIECENGEQILARVRIDYDREVGEKRDRGKMNEESWYAARFQKSDGRKKKKKKQKQKQKKNEETLYFLA
jgi:hypothetical protein